MLKADIKTTEPAYRHLDQGFRKFVVLDVAGESNGLTAGLFYLTDKRVEFCLTPRGDDDFGAFACETASMSHIRFRSLPR